jgi:flagellar M-ring protein FliF
MAFNFFWRELSLARRIGFSVGLVGVAALGVVGISLLFSNDYEIAAQSPSPDKIAAAVREIERLKIPYRVSVDGAMVLVPRAELGRVRVTLGSSGLHAGPTVGFELFNNADFSTTEFTQKINLQRALQGELARTISGISGVSSARVHLVLPDASFLRRKTVSPTAAVQVVLEPKAQLSAAQVFGIQKLIAASVPEIKLDDISVVDGDGITLTHGRTGGTDTETHTQTELKRRVDEYLEAKVKKVLAGLDSEGEFSVSVDATLDWRQTKVTTEEVLPIDADGKTAAGALVRERQMQRNEAPGSTVDSSLPVAPGATLGNMTREAEFKFGHRTEQVVTTPGNLERISVAVLARTSKANTDLQIIKDLVSHAVGARKDRGDSVAIVWLPAPSKEATPSGKVPPVLQQESRPQRDDDQVAPPQPSKEAASAGQVVLLGLLLVALSAVAVLTWRPRRTPTPLSDAEADQMADRIKKWMDGATHART